MKRRKHYTIGYEKGWHIHIYKICGFYYANYCNGHIVNTEWTGVSKTLNRAITLLWNAPYYEGVE